MKALPLLGRTQLPIRLACLLVNPMDSEEKLGGIESTPHMSPLSLSSQIVSRELTPHNALPTES